MNHRASASGGIALSIDGGLRIRLEVEVGTSSRMSQLVAAMRTGAHLVTPSGTYCTTIGQVTTPTTQLMDCPGGARTLLGPCTCL